MTPERLLTELRVQNIAVRADGDVIRCKPPAGRSIPTDLAAAIRELKPELLELLRIEDQEIARRLDAIDDGLLGEGNARTPGACSWCGAAMPGGQAGKCVLCSCAAAELVLERLDSAGGTTYPRSDVPPAETEIETAVTASDAAESRSFWDMKGEEAA